MSFLHPDFLTMDSLAEMAFLALFIAASVSAEGPAKEAPRRAARRLFVLRASIGVILAVSARPLMSFARGILARPREDLGELFIAAHATAWFTTAAACACLVYAAWNLWAALRHGKAWLG